MRFRLFPVFGLPRRILVLLLLFFLTRPAFSATPLHERIDQAIESGSLDFATRAAPLADDAEFMRRVYLTFNGVIPSVDEARAFLQDQRADKRTKLIDRVLSSRHYARHLARVFDNWLMDRRPDKHVSRKDWNAYLRSCFADDKPYDRMAREILSADGTDVKQRAPARYFLDREGEAHILTRDISRIFLGMNLHCAQCHDHPLVPAYHQEHYYGIYAFLSRSFVFADKKSKTSILAEKGEGDVTFQSVFVPKVTKSTGPRVPEGPALFEPKFPRGQEYVVAPAKNVQPIPRYSRRAFLAEQVTANPRFVRTAVNRLWFFMFGRGLVHPIDFDHPANPSSHPALLKLLAEEFAARHFNVKELLREIALSRTYQRSSRVGKDADEVSESSFAAAILKPLSPEELAWSMMQATGLITVEHGAQGKNANEQALLDRLAAHEKPFISLYGNQPGEPDDGNFQATLDQTLFLSNGSLVRGWLSPRTGNLMDRLIKTKDVNKLADELYLSVLTRPPTPEERQETVDFLARHATDRLAALQNLAWALLASAEFRFNH
jgi:hypothetical protein